jgi:hypothetical protein
MTDDEVEARPVWRRLTHGRVRWVAAAAVVAVAAAVLATSAGGSGAKQTSSPSAGAVAAAQPVRWWSNTLAAKGSRVDPADPAAIALRLSPSQPAYCAMLQQTLAAGRSIFPDAHAGDSALVTTTAAFLAEIGRIAPQNVAPDWATITPTIEALVAGKPLPANSSAQAGRNQAAAAAISADAKHNCGLTLSR